MHKHSSGIPTHGALYAPFPNVLAILNASVFETSNFVSPSRIQGGAYTCVWVRAA